MSTPVAHANIINGVRSASQMVQIPNQNTININPLDTIEGLLKRIPSMNPIFGFNECTYSCDTIQQRVLIMLCVYDKKIYMYVYDMRGIASTCHGAYESLQELMNTQLGPYQGLFEGERGFNTKTVSVTDMVLCGKRTRVFWNIFNANDVIQGNAETADGKPFPVSSLGFIDIEQLLADKQYSIPRVMEYFGLGQKTVVLDGLLQELFEIVDSR